MGGELELMCIHSYKLTYAIEEENEKWRIIFTIINVLPGLHLYS
jgi:hypothetical protein